MIEAARIEGYSKKPCENMDERTTYAICAEECAELIQALMKIDRLLYGDDSLRECDVTVYENLDEEVADIILALGNLFDKELVDKGNVVWMAKEKINRYEDLVNRKEVHK